MKLDEICDCGHDALVHSDRDDNYCESCGGKCSAGGWRTYQRQIDVLRKRIDRLEKPAGRTLAESVEAALGLCAEAHAQLRAALIQTIPSDDQIIVDHIRVAHERLDTLRLRLEEADTLLRRAKGNPQ